MLLAAAVFSCHYARDECLNWGRMMHQPYRMAMSDIVKMYVCIPVAMVLSAFGLASTLYWLWIAIRLGSVIMFLLPFFPPTLPIVAPISMYMLIFGVPDWIVRVFGWLPRISTDDDQFEIQYAAK